MKKLLYRLPAAPGLTTMEVLVEGVPHTFPVYRLVLAPRQWRREGRGGEHEPPRCVLLERHLKGQRWWNRRLWRRLARAPEAVAGRSVGRPLPGSAEQPRAAGRALRRRHRTRLKGHCQGALWPCCTTGGTTIMTAGWARLTVGTAGVAAYAPRVAGSGLCATRAVGLTRNASIFVGDIGTPEVPFQNCNRVDGCKKDTPASFERIERHAPPFTIPRAERSSAARETVPRI